jgi:hypothetical protein
MLTLALALALHIATAPVSGGHVSLVVPEGWRQLTAEEAGRLRGRAAPQNEMQRRAQETPPENPPLITIKRDIEGSPMAASVQLMVSTLPAQMKYATSIEAARVVAFGAAAAYQRVPEIEPRELKVAGVPAAEFAMRYSLVDASGASHEMRMRMIVITRKDKMYLLGYSGPADDDTDFAAFDEVVRSLKFEWPGVETRP